MVPGSTDDILDHVAALKIFMITNKIVLICNKSNSPEDRFYRKVNIKEVWQKRSFIDKDIYKHKIRKHHEQYVKKQLFVRVKTYKHIK